MSSNDLQPISWREFHRLTQIQRLGLVDARRYPETVIVSHNETPIVTIPLDELKDRRFELPSRSVPFGILVSEAQDLQLARDILMSGSTSWIVYTLVDDDREQMTALGFELLPSANAPVSIPHPRLWKPDPMVETVLLSLLRQQVLVASNQNEHTTIIDVGSGVGRDVCFLSEELFAFQHLQFIGADQRYRSDNTETTSFWKRRGQDQRCRCLCVNLKQCDSLQVDDDILCVFAVRYWNEALFERFAQELKFPGTIVALSHFGKPNDDYEWTHSTPKVRVPMIAVWQQQSRSFIIARKQEAHLVNRTKLVEMFAGWTIVHHEIAIEADRNRPLVQFVAQRPCA